MKPPSLFSAQIRQAQSTFTTDSLFLAYNNESKFYQQIHNVAKIPFDYVETCPNIVQTQPHEPACDRLWPNAAPILQTAFSCPNIDLNVPYAFHWNVYNLTYLTHFPSTITGYDVVDFIDQFLRSHLFWMAMKLSITCANTAAKKFSEPLMNHTMRWSRLLIIFFEFFFSFFDWFSS